MVLRGSVLRAPVCGIGGIGVEGCTPDEATEAFGSCVELLRVLSPCDAGLAVSGGLRCAGGVAAAVADGEDGGDRGVALRGIGGMGEERCELEVATEAFGSCVERLRGLSPCDASRAVSDGLWAAVGVVDAGACCACRAAASCRALFVA